jgi:hypothetical protein
MATKIQVLEVLVVILDINDLVILIRLFGTLFIHTDNVLDAWQSRIELDVLAHVAVVASLFSRHRVGDHTHGRSRIVHLALVAAILTLVQEL